VSQLLVAQRALTVPGWAKDALWRRAQAIPSLDLRFADNKSLVDAVTGQQLVTFTRASSKTVTNSAGVLETVGIDAPAFDHNPTTGESLGLLVEEQRSNLLLNSATLSTQSVTVAAAANTLSFYGTGTVTLTGVSTAGPLVGTGANNRVSLTFTPIVGVLILTVSGSVTNAQLEAGAFPTSYIPTTTAAVTRSADVASITGSAFSSWYSQSEGTVFAEGRLVNNGVIIVVHDGSFDNRKPQLNLGAIGSADANYVAAGSLVASFTQLSSASVSNRWATAYAVDNFGFSSNGLAPAQDSSGALPSGNNAMRLGSFQNGSSYANGPIKRICFWPQRLPNSTLRTLTQ
jgi:hypothetical protein